MQSGEIFAAIDAGSYELAMKIFEFSKKRGVKEIDHITHRIDLGTETYATGHIPEHHVQELSQILKEYRGIMKEYGVSACRACGTSAFRETADVDIVINRLKSETGITVEILSNSEQRFLNYKAVALRGEEFDKVIEKPTAILDLGGGSLQLSIFDNDKLVATQNMRLGILRMQRALMTLNASATALRPMLKELTSSHIWGFKKMYLRERRVRNLILIDDYLAPYLNQHHIGKMKNGHTGYEDFAAFLEKAQKMPRLEAAEFLNIPVERLPLVEIAAYLIEDIAQRLEAESLWAPGVTLCDGIAFDVAERKKYLRAAHDFDKDIIACAQNMSKRYMGSRKRTEAVGRVALSVFDAMKKMHGLGKRERLLLQIAALLNDCGKYISMLNMAESAYHIIMSTEMIGLSHREREIVANVVRRTHRTEDDVALVSYRAKMPDPEDNLIIAKLTAILGVARALDRTHTLKFKDVDVRLRDDELVLTVDSRQDFAIERGMLVKRAELFTEVYGVTPLLRQKTGKKRAET